MRRCYSPALVLIVLLASSSSGCVEITSSQPLPGSEGPTEHPDETVPAEEQPTQEGPAQEGAELIASKAAMAMAAIDTLEFGASLVTDAEIITEKDSSQLGMTIDGAGGVDIENEKMEMHMDMTLIPPKQSEQGMTLALYIVDGWVYQKKQIPILGEKWTKKELTSEIWATQNYVYPQIALLATAEEVSLLSTEAVRGVPC